MTVNIKHPTILIQGIADGLKEMKNSYNLEVIFYEEEDIVLKCDVSQALDFIINDIYYNEETNWANADRVEIRTI